MRTEQEIKDKIAKHTAIVDSKTATLDATLLHASALHALKWVLER